MEHKVYRLLHVASGPTENNQSLVDRVESLLNLYARDYDVRSVQFLCDRFGGTTGAVVTLKSWDA